MQIGNQYAENKIYRGIKHYDSLPLMSEDLHEYADTMHMKTAYLMNNIIGSGILNTPTIVLSNEGISLREPAVLLIDGDIALVQADTGSPIVSKTMISSAGYSSGTACIVGWYQHITTNNPLVNYGGVDNSKISGLTGKDHEFADNIWNVQVSSRYQFRWTITVVDTNSITEDAITVSIPSRDANGDTTGSTLSITSTSKSGNAYTAPKPTSMDYAESDIYIIPLLKYDYSSGSITNATPTAPTTTKGSSGFIKSETEPTGEYPEGTVWYNHITREFKTYVEGVGFVDSTSKMGFLQYQSVYTFPSTVNTAQDVIVPIDISELEEGDIVQVVYEGLVLVQGEHYTIDYENHTAKLLGFTVVAGDKITFTVTKIVEANDITNITTIFTSHMASTGSATREAHVKLSDSIDSDSDATDGVAATPRAVRESRLIKDSTTNSNYRFGVENGLLYIEEV